MAATRTPREAPAARPTPAQIAVACEQIASLAAGLDREFFYGLEDIGYDSAPERMRLFLDRVRAAIAQIGWMADLGADIPVRGDAQQWLLPPSFHFDDAKGGAA